MGSNPIPKTVTRSLPAAGNLRCEKNRIVHVKSHPLSCWDAQPEPCVGTAEPTGHPAPPATSPAAASPPCGTDRTGLGWELREPTWERGAGHREKNIKKYSWKERTEWGRRAEEALAGSQGFKLFNIAGLK